MYSLNTIRLSAGVIDYWWGLLGLRDASNNRFELPQPTPPPNPNGEATAPPELLGDCGWVEWLVGMLSITFKDQRQALKPS
jgi:hypothetical protein